MNKVIVNADVKKGIIRKEIYGQFMEHLGRCVYEGIWVGEDSDIPNTDGIRNDIIEALKGAKVPILRWPGGCFADEYHWMDGIGPKESRPRMVNTNWGGVVENNHFGTHEFLRLCELTGAEPYIAGNVGSGTVQEMQEWIEYMTFDGESPMADLRRKNGRDEPWKIKYFGVGNENWGCGGGMRPEYYADLFRKYSTYVRNFGNNKVYKIACGAGEKDYNWTEVLMREAGKHMDGISLHYYTIPKVWSDKGFATGFNEDEWFTTLKKTLEMDYVVKRHSTIMDKFDPEKRVGLIIDEWGSWYTVEPGNNPGFLYQQNTMRDALIAGINLNLFHTYERVHMTNIAQMVNVLQALILTEGEKMLLTPTYHVFNMYKVHQDAELLWYDVQSANYQLGEEKIPQVNSSASIDAEGKIHISLCNLSHKDKAVVECDLRGINILSVSGQVLTSNIMDECNTFENPNAITPKAYRDFEINGNSIIATLPPMSVVVLEVCK